MIGTISYSWIENDGDVSFGRLSTKGYDEDPEEYSYMQTVAPFVLLLLTRIRAPVSTSFLLLGVFAKTNEAFIKVIEKSFVGFG